MGTPLTSSYYGLTYALVIFLPVELVAEGWCDCPISLDVMPLSVSILMRSFSSRAFSILSRYL
jgi:hypothetical protein